LDLPEDVLRSDEANWAEYLPKKGGKGAGKGNA